MSETNSFKQQYLSETAFVFGYYTRECEFVTSFINLYTFAAVKRSNYYFKGEVISMFTF